MIKVILCIKYCNFHFKRMIFSEFPWKKQLRLESILLISTYNPLILDLRQDRLFLSTSQINCVTDVVCSMNSLGQKTIEEKKADHQGGTAVGQVKIGGHKSTRIVLCSIIAKPIYLLFSQVLNAYGLKITYLRHHSPHLAGKKEESYPPWKLFALNVSYAKFFVTAAKSLSCT